MRPTSIGFSLMLALGVLCAPSTWAQTPVTATDSDVLTGIVLAEEKKDYDKGIEILTAAAQRLSREDARSGDVATAHLYLGVCYAGKGHDNEATAHFQKALATVPQLTLDKKKVPARAFQLFARAKAQATGSGVSGGGGGGGSVVPIVLGLGAAGGGAAYLVTKAKDDNPGTTADVFTGVLTTKDTFGSRTIGPFPAGAWTADLSWTASDAVLVLEVWHPTQGQIAKGTQVTANALHVEWTGTAGIAYRLDYYLAKLVDTNYELRVIHPTP